jgi:hypothetical protein
MPFDRPQPGPYKRGDEIPGAGEFNQLIRGGRRQITGPGVEEYGDRTVVRTPTSVSQRGIKPPNSYFLQKFVVLEVFDDYLLCKVIRFTQDDAWWVAPDYEMPAEQPTYNHVYVAKPDEIRRSFWDDKTILIDGVAITYQWTGQDVRTATTVAGTVTETLSPRYYPGCIISAQKGVTGITAPNGMPITWTDTNTAARHWPSDGSASVTGVFVEILSIPGTVEGCPLTSARVVFVLDDCSLEPGDNIFLAPLNPGEFRVGDVHRAWATFPSSGTSTGETPVYTADPGIKAQLFATVLEILSTDADGSGTGSPTADGCGRALATLELSEDGCVWTPVTSVVVAPFWGDLVVDKRYIIWRLPGAYVTLVEAPGPGGSALLTEAGVAGTYPVYQAEGHVAVEVLADVDVACVNGQIVTDKTFTTVYVAAVE